MRFIKNMTTKFLQRYNLNLYPNIICLHKKTRQPKYHTLLYILINFPKFATYSVWEANVVLTKKVSHNNVLYSHTTHHVTNKKLTIYIKNLYNLYFRCKVKDFQHKRLLIL